MKCPGCQAENPDYSRVCRHCGAALPSSDRDEGRACKSSNEVTQISDRHYFKDTLIQKRFKVIKELGRGGMGEIFLAEDLKLKRRVAIKRISRSVLTDPDTRIRFLREAQAASQLEHPNICTIYEMGEEGEDELIVMQYIDGVTLDQLLKLKPLSLNKIVDIALQICDALAEAHNQGIIHRDIKPGNIMVDKSGKVKILDFGLAKINPAAPLHSTLSHATSHTEKGLILGTVAYMSPEQARGEALDGRSDIFSFGIVLAEMVDGQNPFLGVDNVTTLYNILHKETPLEREIPDSLKTVLNHTLQKERTKRYDSFAAVRQDLACLNLLPQGPEKATEVIPSAEKKKLLREIEKLQKTDGEEEHLSDLVRQVKRHRASTEVIRTQRWRRLRWTALPLAAGLAVALLLPKFFARRGPAPKPAGAPYILFYDFESQSRDASVAPQITYLIRESLAQFAAIHILDEPTARELSGSYQKKEIDLKALQQHCDIRYILQGKVSDWGSICNIDARLTTLKQPTELITFTVPGTSRDSLLTQQVDTLTRKLYMTIFPDQKEVRLTRIASAFGRRWSAFSDFFQGLRHWQRRETDEAIAALKRASEKSPAMPQAQYVLALAYNFMDEPQTARKHVDAVIPYLEGLTDAMQLRLLALRARLTFDFAKESEYLSRLQERFPYSKEVHFELAETYFHRGQARDAIREYQSALKIDRNFSQALNHMGYCYSYLGDHHQAISLFEAYRNLDQSANSFDSLGDGYFYAGDLILAESNKITALASAPGMFWACLTLADIYTLRAEFAKAVNALQRYQKLRPGAQGAYQAFCKRAFILLLENDPPGALAAVNEALRLFDSTEIMNNSAEAHWLRGLILLAGDRAAEAKVEWEWLLNLCEQYRLGERNFLAPLKFYLHLSALLAEHDAMPEKADQLFKKLLSMKTQLSYWITCYNYPFFLTEYGHFLFRQKRTVAALSQADAALAFTAKYPPALWLKIDVWRGQNKPEWRALAQVIAEVYGPGEERNSRRKRLTDLLRASSSR